MSDPVQDMIRRRLVETRRELDRLHAQEELLLDMLTPPAVRAPSSTVKALVLDDLAAAGDAGVNTSEIVKAANDRGQHVNRGTVSSLLSRLVRDGVAEYRGDRYRLHTASNTATNRAPAASVAGVSRSE